MTSTTATETIARRGVAATDSPIPWYLWAVVFASTSVVVGVIWDISWHRTIGRDTFFTPAHMAIYVGGIVAGLSCGALVLRTTFAGTAEEKAQGVRFWGFYGPLGAWVCIWGSFAMIVSGPFDDWWHNAYGLDVEILSPPHTLLATGIITIQIGAMLMVLARQNAFGAEGRGLQLLFTYSAGVLVLMMAVMATEYIGFPNHWHSPAFYAVSAGIFPIFLVAASRTSMMRWGATLAAGAYMGVTMLMIWILQLFPATPMLGPIYNPVDHMVPPGFPVLLMLPAAAIDLIVQRLGEDPAPPKQWAATLGLGAAFLSVLIMVHWFFAAFLLTSGAQNFFFGADQWDYSSRLGDWRYQYWGTTVSAASLFVALFVAFLSARIGLWWGNWMVRVKR
jgi:hypothetical protein